MKSLQESKIQNSRSVHRVSVSSGAVIVFALSLAVVGCGSSTSTPAAGTGGSSAGSGGTSGGSGGTTSEGTGGAAKTGSGGSSENGSGGSSATGSGGAAQGSGGSSSGNGGSASTGSGGSTTAGGGSSGTAVACTSQAKGGTCLTPTDVCSKTCGPKNAANATVGSKAETCTNGAYVEGACVFPPGDYSCLKVTATTAACPTGTAASSACTATACTPCSGYSDSTGTAKVGFCHCVNGKWSCGSTKEWPCQVDGTSTSTGVTGC